MLFYTKRIWFTLLLFCAVWLRPISVFAMQMDMSDNELATTRYPCSLDRVTINKNVVNGRNLLKQDMFPKTNTVYVIQHDFVLASDITIPDNMFAYEISLRLMDIANKS